MNEMTNDKAIKQLKLIAARSEDELNALAWGIAALTNESNAVPYRVPKKIIVDKVGNESVCYCPTCKRLLCISDYEFPYCHYCGQALKSEVEE